MPSTRSFVAALIVAGLVATLGPDAHAAAGPRAGEAPASEGPGAGRSRIAAPDGDHRPGLVLDHVMVEPEQPGFIVPCVKVHRRYYNHARSDADLTVRIDVSYTSGGEAVQRTFYVPLASMELAHHHPQPAERSWRLVETTVDLGDQPIDVGSAVVGTAELVEGRVTAGRTTR